MAVLAVIAFTSIMIGALMGMLMMTMRVTEHQERAARERRAADGAAVATINHLRLNSGAGVACGSIPAAMPGFKVPFADVGATDDVSVTCEAATDDYGEPGGEVKLVGSGYSGSINWKTWPWPSVITAGVDPTLVHSGPEPLKFNGNVNSASGAAALRDTTTGTPALDIKGEYRQGPLGIGGSGSEPCGILGVEGTRTSIKALGMSCGDPSALAEAVPADYAIDQTVAVLPAGGGACPTGDVVSFTAGRYDRNAVKKLNSWFNGTCRNKTYHFPTGRYWFDASDSTAPLGDRNALIINDASSSFVFGEPNGWDTKDGAGPANFPRACNAGVSATSPGASIVLSGRTEFQHRAGRLAVCPYFAGAEAYPAILQQDTQPSVITVEPVAGAPFGLAKDSVSHKLSSDTVNMTCSLPAQGWMSPCESKQSFNVKLSSESSTAPLKSVQFRITGYEPNFPVSLLQQRRVAFDLTFANHAPCKTGPQNGSVVGSRESTFELISGDCAGISGYDLDDAVVKATFIYNYTGPCFDYFVGYCYFNAQQVKISDLGVVVETWTGGAATATTPGSGSTAEWKNVNNAKDDNSTAATFNTICGFPVCGADVKQMSVERSLTLSGVSLTGSLLADDHVNSLGVVIKQLGDENQGANLATLPGSTELTLTTKDGFVCKRSFVGVANIKGSIYFPMIDGGSSTCETDPWTSGQPLKPSEPVGDDLADASVTVKFRLDCINPTSATECGSLISYLQPVGIQYVGLMATTDSYKGPVTRARLSVDAATSATGSSANFFGGAYMPNSALDIFWNGTASGASIFGGELQLWSLGSKMAAGASGDVVCCTKPEIDEHKVRVTAHIGGESKLSVVVKLWADKREPEVLEWTQCGRNGACA